MYKPGSVNRVADALSRHTTHSSQCSALSVVLPQWLSIVSSRYDSDDYSKELLTKLSLDPIAVPHYSLTNGVLYYKKRIWVGSSPDLRLRLPAAFHSSAIGGHSGFPATYKRMKQLFAWKGMKSAVEDFVKHCQICQQSKPDRARLPGLIQPLPVPHEAWQIISLDFVEGLLTSGPANCILVVVDSLTAWAFPFIASSFYCSQGCSVILRPYISSSWTAPCYC